MKTAKNIILLEDEIRGFSPEFDGVTYTEESGVRIFIPYQLLFRLYEGSKYYIEKNGGDWNEFCNRFFS